MKRIVTLAGILSPFVLALIVQACATSSETTRPDVGSPSVVPDLDSGVGGPGDTGDADRPTLPCAAGNLCEVQVPLSFGYVTAIRGRSKNDVWATGTRGALMHYGGQAWTSVVTDSSETVSSLFLTPDELWMIAGNFVTRRGAEPGTVRRMQLGTPHTLSGVAVLPNGDAYLALLRTTKYSPLVPPLVKIVDFDAQEVEATAWPLIPGVDPEAAAASPEEMMPRASCLVPDHALWLVGDHAKVVRYPVTPLGTGEFVSVGSQANLKAAWGHDEHLWAVGAGGTILHYDGATWHAQDSGTSVELEAVFGFSDRDVWVAGPEGTVLHFDGERWSKIDVGDYHGRLETIWGSASDDVWIGGELAMFHWGALP
ncbi:sialidase family protein [Labilithrix luteola]|nr:hypothetical protein [Labilithrix luteola]